MASHNLRTYNSPVAMATEELEKAWSHLLHSLNHQSWFWLGKWYNFVRYCIETTFYYENGYSFVYSFLPRLISGCSLARIFHMAITDSYLNVCCGLECIIVCWLSIYGAHAQCGVASLGTRVVHGRQPWYKGSPWPRQIALLSHQLLQ